MKEISIIGSGLSTMCRLCLSSGVTLLDIFYSSSKMKNRLAGVIMKCAAVQISRGDEKPHFICQSCYTKLEETHQFLTQIEQSDRTLQRYLQLLRVSDKPVKAERSVQPSEENLILDTINDIIVKNETLELNDVFDTDLNRNAVGSGDVINENKSNKEMCSESVIKVEPDDENLFYLPTECATDTENISSNIDDEEFICEEFKIDISETKVSETTTVNWKEQEPENYSDNSLILTESFDDTEFASSNGGVNKISCKDTKINIVDVPQNLCDRAANQTGNLSRCKETKGRISINRKKYKKSNKVISYQCNVCNKCYQSRSDLYFHKRTHAVKKLYKCNFCIKCFVSSEELKIHKRIHTGEKSYQCDLCNKRFSRSSILHRHKLQHTGEKPYQCDLCNKRFANSGNLNKHKLHHTGEKPYQCDLCNKRFAQSSTLNTHKLQHTGEKPYQCDLGNKRFAQSSTLNTHKLRHTGEKPYQCDLCNKRFAQSSNFNTHKRQHTGEKPYQCDFCNKRFANSGNLKKHKLHHTGEKPYQCDLCNKRFAQSSNLNSHKRQHTGEKPYQCDLCNKRFAHSSNLNTHKRQHTGEKPYQCDFCDKRFAHSCNLNKHKRQHTSEKPYQCDP